MSTPLLAVGDAVWQSIVAGVVTLTLAWMAHKMNAIAKVADKTHTLVNSQMGGVLTLVDELSRWKSNREPTPENIKASELAARMLKEHEGKQAKVDSKEQK